MKYVSKQSRGFTLIELLVVVTIITLLISILLPALAAARSAARTVQCASTERQIGMAFTLYANDNDGYFPGPSKWDPSKLKSAPVPQSSSGSLPNYYQWWKPDKIGNYLMPTNGDGTIYKDARIYDCPSHPSTTNWLDFSMTQSVVQYAPGQGAVGLRRMTNAKTGFVYLTENHAGGVYFSPTHSGNHGFNSVGFWHPAPSDPSDYQEVIYSEPSTFPSGKAHGLAVDGHVELYGAKSLQVATIWETKVPWWLRAIGFPGG